MISDIMVWAAMRPLPWQRRRRAPRVLLSTHLFVLQNLIVIYEADLNNNVVYISVMLDNLIAHAHAKIINIARVFIVRRADRDSDINGVIGSVFPGSNLSESHMIGVLFQCHVPGG